MLLLLLLLAWQLKGRVTGRAYAPHQSAEQVDSAVAMDVTRITSILATMMGAASPPPPPDTTGAARGGGALDGR